MNRRPYYASARVTLYTGDARAVIPELPSESVQCVVTSPPYWGLRDYGTGSWLGGDPSCAHDRGSDRRCRRCGGQYEDGQIGLEATPQAYVDQIRAVARQLHRVLADTGTLWLNLGDCYASSPPGRCAAPMRASTLTGLESVRARRELVRAAGVNRATALPMKNLLGMPWRVAFALQADGWILRNAIVWHKLNGMPESVRDRLSCRYEMLFLLVKQRHYWFDLDPIRVPLARTGSRRDARTGGEMSRRRRVRKYDDVTHFLNRPPGPGVRPTGRRHDGAHPRGKNPGDVWSVPTKPLHAAHFAAFPVDLPLRAIAAGCPRDGVVLDPFSGAGTTGLAAQWLGRSFIGVDMNSRFHDIAITLLQQPDGQHAGSRHGGRR